MGKVLLKKLITKQLDTTTLGREINNSVEKSNSTSFVNIIWVLKYFVSPHSPHNIISKHRQLIYDNNYNNTDIIIKRINTQRH